MTPLSLQQINKTSPYQVTKTDGEAYCFHANNGVDYDVSLIEEMMIGGCRAYQIIIAKVNDIKSAHDPNVRKVIFAIIDEFFNANNDLLLYICDSSDGREAIRNRLFLSWFEHNSEEGRFVIRTANANIEGSGFYAAIIIEKANPMIQSVIEEFDYASSCMTENKP